MIPMEKKIRRLVFWTLTVLTMAAIFLFSSQTAVDSGALSEGVAGRFYTFFHRIFPALEVASWHAFVSFVRKCAHFFCFFCLGLSVTAALSADVSDRWKNALYAFLFCFVYAVSDEVHQLYIPGRAMLFKDVCIDSLGASCAIGIVMLFLLFTGKEEKRRTFLSARKEKYAKERRRKK